MLLGKISKSKRDLRQLYLQALSSGVFQTVAKSIFASGQIARIENLEHDIVSKINRRTLMGKTPILLMPLWIIMLFVVPFYFEIVYLLLMW